MPSDKFPQRAPKLHEEDDNEKTPNLEEVCKSLITSATSFDNLLKRLADVMEKDPNNPRLVPMEERIKTIMNDAKNPTWRTNAFFLDESKSPGSPFLQITRFASLRDTVKRLVREMGDGKAEPVAKFNPKAEEISREIREREYQPLRPEEPEIGVKGIEWNLSRGRRLARNKYDDGSVGAWVDTTDMGNLEDRDDYVGPMLRAHDNGDLKRFERILSNIKEG